MNKIPRPHFHLAFGLALLLALNACSREEHGVAEMDAASAPAMEQRAMSADRIAAQKARNPYLAFEHYYSIELPEESIRERFEATVDQCSEEDFHGCTIIQATLNEDKDYGGRVSAHVQMRIATAGIDPLIAVAAEGGDIASQSSRAEDLAEAVTDTEKRLEMLRSYRERLQNLESRAAEDIESLIKVSSELARVQSDIEQLQGRREHLQKRLDLDLLNIDFFSEQHDDLFAPILRALDRFFYTLSSGTSSIITAVAWVLPWVIGLLILFPLMRWTWRRVRR